MKDVDLKKLGTLRLCGGGALVALATWGVWAFCSGGFSASNGWESAFDGWQYGREDQKTASAALAAAGLDEWSWDEGRLLVPKNKKNEYQTALAEAGAYPKAPSESRRDAIREMGAFESEAKIRMRELDACAFQLERTLERTGGIEYATVGVRARREQAGLTAKTVVTASIGVACREGCELDANLLSAITVAAKHQLGVDANENISILDLKAGKSYFGSEKLVGNGNELSLAAEKERVETYWRDKLSKTFDYMGGVRVSVAAELVVAEPDDVVRTELGDVLGDLNERSETNDSSYWSATAKTSKNERATSAAERLAQVEIENAGEIGRPRPLATWSGDLRQNARTGGAFARLGNPVATRNAASAEAVNLAQVERTKGNGVLAVGATERRGVPNRGVVPAGYLQDAENAKNEENGQVERLAQATKENAVKENKSSAPSETVAQDAGKREKSENKVGAVGKKEEGKKGSGESEERVRFRVRALAVRVGTPRGYVRRVAQNLKAESAVETFASGETAGSWSALYRTTEQKIVAETKNIALSLLRPFAEQNGWSENELTRSVTVDVFADPSDFNEGWGGANASKSSGAENAENNPNGAFEVVANFGRADTAERVAEETTVDVPTAEDREEAENEEGGEASGAEIASEFWTAWAARLDEKTKAGVGVGVGVLAILTLAAGATVRRRKKAGVRFDEDAEIDKRGERAKQTDAQSKEKKQNKGEKRNASKKGNKKDGKNRGNEGVEDGAEEKNKRRNRQNEESQTLRQDLRIARVGEKTGNAQKKETEKEAEFKERGEETRDETRARNAQNPQIRRFVSTARQNVGVNGGNGRPKPDELEGRGDWGGFSDIDGLDDWDEFDDDLLEIRSAIERERTRVGNETPETPEPSGSGTTKNVGDAARRREALDFVARNPERAAASLQRWLRPGA